MKELKPYKPPTAKQRLAQQYWMKCGEISRALVLIWYWNNKGWIRWYVYKIIRRSLLKSLKELKQTYKCYGLKIK